MTTSRPTRLPRLPPTLSSERDPRTQYCSLFAGGTLIPLDFLRRQFTSHWPVSARIINFCRFGGALTALISIGDPPIWLLLFPLMMAAAFKVMQRWGWLAPIPDSGQQRRGLLALYAAPLCVPLIFLVYLLLLVVFGAVIGLFVFAYVSLTGSHILPRQQENLSLIAAMIGIVMCWSLLYCGLHGYALRRFTRAWYPALILKMAACICASILVTVFVVSKVNWSHGSTIPLQPLWPIIMQWIFSVVLVSQMGALFGKWLASPMGSQLPVNATTYP